ncbi:hypothetical protein EDB87DRAFT_286792 [Lactarius vividus]|nr:hypothetical protein EDB87DRAFT_286792 [Lactarius vividus]
MLRSHCALCRHGTGCIVRIGIVAFGDPTCTTYMGVVGLLTVNASRGLTGSRHDSGVGMGATRLRPVSIHHGRSQRCIFCRSDCGVDRLTMRKEVSGRSDGNIFSSRFAVSLLGSCSFILLHFEVFFISLRVFVGFVYSSEGSLFFGFQPLSVLCESHELRDWKRQVATTGNIGARDRATQLSDAGWKARRR